MAYTQADIDTLDEAIASGTLRVKYGDKEHTFQNTSELIKARDYVDGKVNPTPGSRVMLGSFDRGSGR